MRFEIVRTLDVWGVEQDCTVRGTWTQGRPAPPCSDHDSPAFSDSGDPGEIEVEEVRDAQGRIVPEGVWEGLINLDDLYEAVDEAARADDDAHECRHEMGWD